MRVALARSDFKLCQTFLSFSFHYFFLHSSVARATRNVGCQEVEFRGKSPRLEGRSAVIRFSGIISGSGKPKAAICVKLTE